VLDASLSGLLGELGFDRPPIGLRVIRAVINTYP